MEKKKMLESALIENCNTMINNGITDIKSYEIAFQDVIENIYTEQPWWEVTGCDIFMHLLAFKDPWATIHEILTTVKEAV